MQPKVSSRPRIHITAKTLPRLRKAARSSHAFYYGKLIEAADDFIATSMPKAIDSGIGNRAYGDILPVLAMARLFSGDEKYLDAVRTLLRLMVAAEKWGDNLDLVTGHIMSGVAIAYDWLHDDIPAAERKALAAKMAYHAEILDTYIRNQRVWWHDYFLHNWAHVIIGGLAYAASALHGENKRTGDWMDTADGFFTEVERALPEDGSYQEGLAYMSYAWECMARYFDLARQLYGRNHFGAGWLRRAPYNILYSTVPAPKPHDNAMVFGDGPRHFEWHGPAHMMFRSAAEYRDGVIQGFTQALVDKGIGVTRTGTWLNMLWYDPSVEPADYRTLPTMHFLENLDTVSMRSGWDEDAMMVAFKCSNNAGRKTMREYPGRDLGSGHAHPDAASFQVFAFGRWLAVDAGYTHFKQSANHNTILVNGVGQLGGERTWYDMMECLSAGAECRITDVKSTHRYDYARADATAIYRPRAGLTRFVRHMVFLKPHDILIVDELAAETGSRFEWRLHSDDSILQMSDGCRVTNGGAGLFVKFLSAGVKASVRRWPIEGNTPSGMAETALLSAEPESPVQKTIFVTLLSAYAGEAPSTDAKLVEANARAVLVELRRGRKREIVSVDLLKAKVGVK